MSRDYATVSPSFWTGATGRALRGDHNAQIIAFYLITSQHSNMIGVFHCPPIFIAYETGIPIDEVLRALQRLASIGYCEYDAERELVWVCEMAKYQIAEQLKPSDKRVIGISKEFTKIPDCKIKKSFYSRYKDAFYLPDGSPESSPFKAPSKPLRSQEQEQEQEQDRKSVV